MLFIVAHLQAQRDAANQNCIVARAQGRARVSSIGSIKLSLADAALARCQHHALQ
jgi:hypothetical protein